MAYYRLHLIGLVLAGLLILAQPASAFAPPHDSSLSYQRLSKDGDYFLNYDGARNGSSASRDWPVSLIFYSDASVNRVKSFYDGSRGFNRRGGTIYEGYKDLQRGGGYSSPRYDGDKGKKTDCDSKAQDKHFRVYGGLEDRLTDPRYGNFVVVTTHIDSGEGTESDDPCTGEKYFGYSESVEDYLAGVAKSSYQVREDYKRLYNKESIFLDTSGADHHYWQSDGMATTVKMP